MMPSRLEEMQDKAYRHGIISAQIEIDLPLQIRALRKQREWTQPELAERADMKQPRISAMEKPGGANFTLETLKRLAGAFDVALIVRFAPFSELVRWSDQFDPDSFSVDSFGAEVKSIKETCCQEVTVNVGAGSQNEIRRTELPRGYLNLTTIPLLPADRPMEQWVDRMSAGSEVSIRQYEKENRGC